MARIRTIKPGFFTSEELSSVSVEAQLLAGGLLCYADDEGYFNAHPALVKAAVFPLRETAEPVSKMLKDLGRINYVRFGTGEDGKRYGFIVTFAEHQKVSHLTPSKVKKMEIVWEVSGKIPEDSVKAPDVLRPELNRTELNGIEKEDKPSRRKAPCDVRFKECVEILERYHRKFVSKTGFDVWFGNRGGKQLKNLLNSEPQLDVKTFEQAVGARARSPGMDHEQLVYQWVFHVIGSNRGNGNGQIRSVSKADERERRIVEQAQKYADYRPGSAVDSESQSALALPGNGRDGVRGLAGDAELIPPKRDSDGTRPPHAAAAKA